MLPGPSPLPSPDCRRRPTDPSAMRCCASPHGRNVRIVACSCASRSFPGSSDSAVEPQRPSPSWISTWWPPDTPKVDVVPPKVNATATSIDNLQLSFNSLYIVVDGANLVFPSNDVSQISQGRACCLAWLVLCASDPFVDTLSPGSEPTPPRPCPVAVWLH